MSRIDDERTKLSANALDRASTACLTVGIVAPIAAYLYGVSTVSGWTLLAVCYVWLAVAAGLHLLARYVLGRLDP